MLHFFAAEIESEVSQLLRSSIILKIFSKRLIPKGQRKLLLTRFHLGNILSSLGLETATVHNNHNNLRQEKGSSLHFLLIRTIVPKDWE